MILLLDNYDSFVYNLSRYVRELGEHPVVVRNDAISLDEIRALAPTHIIVSPGPCTPAEAGISVEAIREFGARIPILGVCLGHQAIGTAYGAEIVRARKPMHGKTSRIHHDGSDLFADVPSPFTATRYHSLVIAPDSLPPSLRITATSEDGEIMAVEHRTNPVVGVQFHPESALTEHGYWLIDRFLHGDRAHESPLPDRADLAFAPADSPESTVPPVELVR
ncbi:MAG TPA: aminodeoxychorismate/anthranilate synthase component II [Gemmatimonadaceae bacterium]|nr:aminodeoxychorismate/anthranilate synthase component II [Gemmatimonadaceae bacterium]